MGIRRYFNPIESPPCRPPGERILKNVAQVFKNTEVVVFLVQMMFAGTFWGYIEGFLFWYGIQFCHEIHVRGIKFHNTYVIH